jgi:preprotein translocase subunit YajC
MWIESAYANATAAPQAATGLDFMSFVPMVVIFVLFYVLLIRPQQKRLKEHQALLSAVQKGDEIQTSGGLLGRVTKVNEKYISVEIADAVVIQLERSAIQAVLPKGTLKANA